MINMDLKYVGTSCRISTSDENDFSCPCYWQYKLLK
jgi:hypothetical protein